MNYYNFIHSFCGRAFTILLMSFCVGLSVSAQNDNEDIVIPVEAQQFFDKLVPKKDTTNSSVMNKYREDKFIKRISIHTNVVDWVTLVPNIGVEIDLTDSPRNNYSISVFGKYNGNSKHGSLVYNVGAVRVEGRKYWRTGKFGNGSDAGSKLYLMPEFVADTLASAVYYLDSVGMKAKSLGVNLSEDSRYVSETKDKKDSVNLLVDSLGLQTNSLRNWIYNNYAKFSREVTSGRSLDNPRNWRAYYFGVWAGYDNWDVSLTGNGKRGNGLGLGILGGYTLPLIPQEFPKEGSLDLDLGIAIGVKAVNYDAYIYDPTLDEGQRYVVNPTKSTKSWKVVPFPVIQDVHVSLIWRFRGIKNKVDKSLIDDYFNKVSKFENDRDSRNEKKTQRRVDKESLALLVKERLTHQNDSATFWNPFHLRRIENAKRINPDTVLTDVDQYLYLKITENLDSTAAKKRLQEYKDSVVVATENAIKQAKIDSIQNAKQAKKDSIKSAKQARIDRQKFERDSVKMAKLQVDSLKHYNDSVQKAMKKLAKSKAKDDTLMTSTVDSTIQSIKIPASDTIDVDKASSKKSTKKSKSKKADKDTAVDVDTTVKRDKKNKKVDNVKSDDQTVNESKSKKEKKTKEDDKSVKDSKDKKDKKSKEDDESVKESKSKKEKKSKDKKSKDTVISE